MDKIQRVQEDLHDVTEMMRQNIEAVVDRGEHLELLMDKSDNLSSQARQFQKQSKGLRKALWWKNVKMMLSLAFVFLFIIMIVVVSLCGWTFGSCSR
mmetsp:Transcript_32079/g.67469  ORF Transcript_32079/g.67469 Transcript_32079/m.67469 type:complete len:97 (+) Transcript_32079:232-522(+)